MYCKTENLIVRHTYGITAFLCLTKNIIKTFVYILIRFRIYTSEKRVILRPFFQIRLDDLFGCLSFFHSINYL